MASSTFVKDVLYRCSVQLHDISPQFSRWKQKEMVAALNDGEKAIAKYIPSSCARVDSVKLRPGTKQSIERILAGDIKPGDGSDPAEVLGQHFQAMLRNMGTDGVTPGRAVRVVDRDILDVNTPTWHQDTGSPVTQFVFDPRFPKVYYVYPGVPATGTYWGEVSFLANPVEIPLSGDYAMDGASTAKITVDDRFVDDLIHYVLARCYLKDAEFAANPQLSALHTQLFTSSINAQAAALTGTNPNLQGLPMVPSAPVARGG